MIDNPCLLGSTFCRRDGNKTEADGDLPLHKVLQSLRRSMDTDRVGEVDWDNRVVNVLPYTW